MRPCLYVASDLFTNVNRIEETCWERKRMRLITCIRKKNSGENTDLTNSFWIPITWVRVLGLPPGSVCASVTAKNRWNQTVLRSERGPGV